MRDHESARALFHFELGTVSDLLYFAGFFGVMLGISGLVGLRLGLDSRRRRLSLCSVSLAVLLLGTLLWPWIAYGQSIEIVARVVD